MKKDRNKTPLPNREEISDADFYWLVGLLEGEGSFRYLANRADEHVLVHITLVMVDEDIVRRAASIMKAVVGLPPIYERVDGVVRQQVYRVVITSKPAIAWMKLLREHMGKRRQGQIDVCLKIYDIRYGWLDKL